MKPGLPAILAWSALVAIAFVTLAPSGLRPRIDLPINLERALPFIVAGGLFAFAYPKKIWWAAAIVVFGVFGLELLQGLQPGRHPRLSDAVAKSAGAFLGLALGWLTGTLRAILRRP